MLAVTNPQIHEPEAWRADAKCASGSPESVQLFFSEQLDDIARARQFCQDCPVREPCLEAAIRRREPWGVWGGELFANGKVLAQKRNRGRPPKVAPAQFLSPEIRPQDVLEQRTA
jgi:WhiB family redox-sensing transcriptional regulator